AARGHSSGASRLSDIGRPHRRSSRRRPATCSPGARGRRARRRGTGDRGRGHGRGEGPFLLRVSAHPRRSPHRPPSPVPCPPSPPRPPPPRPPPPAPRPPPPPARSRGSRREPAGEAGRGGEGGPPLLVRRVVAPAPRGRERRGGGKGRRAPAGQDAEPLIQPR